MKHCCVGIVIVMLSISTCLIPRRISAQQDGFLGASDVAPPTSESMLPPGAVVQGAYVQHAIQSQHENLHLLASFYYGNPREWRKIYNDNRGVIKNPNRLPVNEVIRIHVGDNWQPMVAYDTWFALAVRNGEWRSDVRWQRANNVAVPSGPPPEPLPATPPKSPAPPPPAAPTPAPTPIPPTPVAVPKDAPPSEHPAEKPAEEPASVPAEEPAEEPATAPESDVSEPAPPSESAPPPEPIDSAQPEEPPAEEEVPAAPAF